MDQMRLGSRTPLRQSAIVVGGSIGGLTAALVLRDRGWNVEVLERSTRPLTARGVGIVAHPATVRYLVERRGIDLRTMTVASHWVRYMGSQGTIVHERPADYAFTSYYALYRELVDAFDDACYHLGQHVIDVQQDGASARVTTQAGASHEADLVIFADGVHSTGRQLIAPEAHPEYAGYIAWRGTVGEQDLSDDTFGLLYGVITYHLLRNSHLLAYPIPNTDGAVEPGRRIINWIWYLNVEEGPELDALMTDEDGVRRGISLDPASVRPEVVEVMRSRARELLPVPLAEMVTKSTAPFLQEVVDITVPRLVRQRACLIGDAATVLRPHVAVGTAKAAQAAWALGDALGPANGDVATTLSEWEANQMEIEQSVLRRSQEAGRSYQFDNSWEIGAPLPFGLIREGDSEMAIKGAT